MKTNRKNRLCILLVGALFAAGGLTSHAATIVQTQNFSFVPDGSQVLNFLKFNSALGTLDNVRIEITLTKSGGTFAVDNDSETGGTATLTHRITLGSLTNSLGAASMLKEDSSAIAAGLEARTDTDVVVAGTSGDPTDDEFNATGEADYYKLDPVPSASDSDAGDVGSSGRASYAGNEGEQYTITVAAGQNFNVSGVGGVAQSTTPATASGSMVVTYNYAAVPEPGTLMFLGVAGLLAVLRRRAPRRPSRLQ